MVYVFLADGFEEVEALSVVDCLRRAGVDTITVGIGSEYIKGSHNITVKADITDSEAVCSPDLNMIVLPGGMPGTLNLEKSGTVQNIIKFCADNEKYLAAICAAPSIYGHMGLLKGKKAVCYPGFEKDLSGAEVLYDRVCVSGNIITSRGPGTALEFGLKLVEILVSAEVSRKLSEGMICQ